MLNITRRDIEEAQAYARDAMRGGSSRDYNGATGERRTAGGVARQTLGMAVGAVGVGYVTGRYGAVVVGGKTIPVDLAAGIGIHALTFLASAWFKIEAPKDVNNVADGILAGYLTKLGVGLGTSMRQKAGETPLNLSNISGEERSGGRAAPAQLSQGQRADTRRNKRPMSEAELRAMAQEVR